MSLMKHLAKNMLANIAKHSANPHAHDAEKFARSKHVVPARFEGEGMPLPELDNQGAKKRKPKPPSGGGSGGAAQKSGVLHAEYESLSKSELIYTHPLSRAIRLEWK